MLASPVIPGMIYHVKGHGLDLNILAGHGCDAICIALGMVLPC